MDEGIQQKLREFHEFNTEARKHFQAHELKPSEPIKVHTEIDLLRYSKWRTKADIALNEYHQLLVQKRGAKFPWSTEELLAERLKLEKKLHKTEKWLNEHTEVH